MLTHNSHRRMLTTSQSKVVGWLVSFDKHSMHAFALLLDTCDNGGPIDGLIQFAWTPAAAASSVEETTFQHDQTTLGRYLCATNQPHATRSEIMAVTAQNWLIDWPCHPLHDDPMHNVSRSLVYYNPTYVMLYWRAQRRSDVCKGIRESNNTNQPANHAFHYYSLYYALKTWIHSFIHELSCTFPWRSNSVSHTLLSESQSIRFVIFKLWHNLRDLYDLSLRNNA